MCVKNCDEVGFPTASTRCAVCGIEVPLDEAVVPVVKVALPEIAESAVAPRIAAAEARDWDEGASGSVNDTDAGPPVAAS